MYVHREKINIQKTSNITHINGTFKNSIQTRQQQEHLCSVRLSLQNTPLNFDTVGKLKCRFRIH